MSWFQSSPTTTDGNKAVQDSYKPMKRNERQRCWESRDVFFACLDKSNILDSIREQNSVQQRCKAESEEFERDCASSWVIYFKQKRVADHEKAQKIKKLEAEGAVPIQQAQESSRWKFW